VTIQRFELNQTAVAVDVPDGMPVLWVLRDVLGLTGTKYGCGRMLCGACTVHVDGKATRTCMLPVERIVGRRVTTIEGLGKGTLHRVQRAWIAESVPQCGYCQSGQIMAAAALLAEHSVPTDAQVNAAMRDVLCRCGTYQRIRRAIRRAARER
jgi:aerobic-type carbon monoxide dehydrogenase small subunit (CoxS/CutS family)